jgi:hypothetical protein
MHKVMTLNPPTTSQASSFVVNNTSSSFLSQRRSNENKDIAQSEEVKQTAGDAPVEVVRKFKRVSVAYPAASN